MGMFDYRIFNIDNSFHLLIPHMILIFTKVKIISFVFDYTVLYPQLFAYSASF